MTMACDSRGVADPDDLLTVTQIAVLLDMDDQFVRDMLRNGVIPAEKDTVQGDYRSPPREQWRARIVDVEAYRDTHPTRPGRRRAVSRDEDPMFHEFRELLAELAEAQAVIDALMEKRNRLVVAWSDRGRSDADIGEAIGRSKQAANRIRHISKS